MTIAINAQGRRTNSLQSPSAGALPMRNLPGSFRRVARSLANAAQPLRILFIGNSNTSSNELPHMFAGLAQSGDKGLTIETQMITTGGSTLRAHLRRREATNVIRAGHWDYVVLQEQSSLGTALLINGIPRPSRLSEFWESVRDFDKEIKAVGAKTVLYHTWAHQSAPEAQATLDYAFRTLAKDIGAIDVPVWAGGHPFRFCDVIPKGRSGW